MHSLDPLDSPSVTLMVTHGHAGDNMLTTTYTKEILDE